MSKITDKGNLTFKPTVQDGVNGVVGSMPLRSPGEDRSTPSEKVGKDSLKAHVQKKMVDLDDRIR